MGWSFGWPTKTAVIEDMTRTWQDGSDRIETIAKKSTKSGCWTVDERTAPDGTKTRTLAVILIERHGKDYGYKGICEEMGPYASDCPLEFLDMVPEPDSEEARSTRARIRAWHAQDAVNKTAIRQIRVGATVPLYGVTIPEVTITSVKPYRGTYAGRSYRIPPRLLTPTA